MTRSRGAKRKWMTGTSDLPGGRRTRQRRPSITRRGRGVVIRVFTFLLGLAFEEDLKKDFRSYLAPYTVSSWKVGLALDNTKRATEWTTCSELRGGERVARDIATYDSIIWGRNGSLPFSRDVGCLCGNLSLSNLCNPRRDPWTIVFGTQHSHVHAHRNSVQLDLKLGPLHFPP